MGNATMISTKSSQDLFTVRTKNFANEGMEYEQFVILTSCSIPYTDLRIIIMNYVLKRWNGQLRPEN
jgi:hypothetical protein